MDGHQTNPSDYKQQGQKALVVDLSDQLTWSRKEAAIMCGVSTATFSKWVREGEMPQPLKSGRFSADAIRSWLAADGAASGSTSSYDRWKAAQ